MNAKKREDTIVDWAHLLDSVARSPSFGMYLVAEATKILLARGMPKQEARAKFKYFSRQRVSLNRSQYARLQNTYVKGVGCHK